MHHLNQSRSMRILWLLEELGVAYEIVSHQRDAKSFMAPDSLRAVHPLGKSPVVEVDGQLFAESGAITELLIERFASERLRPAVDSNEYGEYLQWIHFAESSFMVPIVLEIFTRNSIKSDDVFLDRYIAREKHKMLSYLNKVVENKSFIVANKLSGADFMLSFDLIMMARNKELDDYVHVKQYALQLASLDSYQRAMRLEDNYDQAVQPNLMK
ncbi:glutathione S-transferase family protein [Psychrobacter sp. 1U2]|uniref:glutathione S-transferase family protein n=1 Tax=Psychrobacter sp. 1U2 TaxID=3453577 RepID=UPI003F457872